MTAADGVRFARQGYDGAAAAWADGAELVYGPLADALLARAPDVAGRVVLDVGAGTGAVSRRLAATGANTVAVDASWPMLAHGVVATAGRRGRHQSVAAGRRRGRRCRCGVRAQPPRLSPVVALVEMRRVVRRGGFIVASVFSTAHPPAAKSAIDGALAAAGWEPPDWYRFFKSVEGQLGSAAGMRLAAQAADLEHIDVVEGPLATGVNDPRAIVRYRHPSRSGLSSWPDSTKRPDGGSSTNALPPSPSSTSPTTRGSC